MSRSLAEQLALTHLGSEAEIWQTPSLNDFCTGRVSSTRTAIIDRAGRDRERFKRFPDLFRFQRRSKTFKRSINPRLNIQWCLSKNHSGMHWFSFQSICFDSSPCFSYWPCCVSPTVKKQNTHNPKKKPHVRRSLSSSSSISTTRDLAPLAWASFERAPMQIVNQWRCALYIHLIRFPQSSGTSYETNMSLTTLSWWLAVRLALSFDPDSTWLRYVSADVRLNLKYLFTRLSNHRVQAEAMGHRS